MEIWAPVTPTSKCPQEAQIEEKATDKNQEAIIIRG